jgi:tellurite resistance protein
VTFEELEAKVAELRQEAALMLSDLDESLGVVERLRDEFGTEVDTPKGEAMEHINLGQENR